MAITSSNLVTKYQPLVDEKLKVGLLTQDLEATDVKFDGSHTVKVAKIDVPSLGNYNRGTGFTTGTLNVEWEDWTLSQDRGISFSIDNYDNEETLDAAFGGAMAQLEKVSVAPELDTYRFAKLAGTTGINTVAAAALTNTTTLAAITTAEAQLDNDEVAEDRILYITPVVYNKLKEELATKAGLSRIVEKNVDQNFDTFDGMKVVKVPQSRFYTTCTIGTSGYTTGGNAINFMIVSKSAVQATVKAAKLRIFEPEVNQSADAYKIDFRIYHDVQAYANKVKGIYLHKATA